uniref:Amidohydro-rel domain-containing protein n=1 Tax=Parastrongyloides trichosuri TaxID=131310 RepID=A0A0N4ZAX2_PARTI
MFPFLPFLTFSNSDVERRRRNEYITIQISSETGLPIFKRNILPIPSTQKGLITYTEEEENKRTNNKSTIVMCQIDSTIDSCDALDINVNNEQDKLYQTSVGEKIENIEGSEPEDKRDNLMITDKSNDILVIGKDINEKDINKSDILAINNECNLVDNKLVTDVLADYPVKESAVEEATIISDVNENNLLENVEMDTSFYIEKINKINLDEISEDEIFGRVKKTSLKFNPSFKESSPIPVSLNDELDEKKEIDDLRHHSSTESSKIEEESPIPITPPPDKTPTNENVSITDNILEVSSYESQGKVIHSPIPLNDTKISKGQSLSKQDLTKSSSGKSSPSIKSSRKDISSPRDIALQKNQEFKKSGSRISSPLLKTSTSQQRIHSISPRPSSSSQTNLDKVRKISSSGRLTSPGQRNIRNSNDRIDQTISRPMDRLSDMGRTKSTPPNVLKQQALGASSKVAHSSARQSNRNPFAVSQGMLEIFGDSSGGTAACFNKINPPNPALANKNFKRSNVLEREQDQPSIFPNTKPIPGKPSSTSAFNYIPDHDKVHEEATRRGNWTTIESSFSIIGGMSSNNECDTERYSENYDTSNECVIADVEHFSTGSCALESHDKSNYEDVVGRPAPERYGGEDNEEENKGRIESEKTSVISVMSSESPIICKEELEKGYNNVSNCPEDAKINWYDSKESEDACNEKGNQFYKDEFGSDNGLYGNRDDVNPLTAGSLSHHQYITQACSSDGVLYSEDNRQVYDIESNINQQIIYGQDSQVTVQNIDKESGGSRGTISQGSPVSGNFNDSEEESLEKRGHNFTGDSASDTMVKPGDISISSGSGGALFIKNGKIVNDDSSYIANILIEGSIIRQVGNQFPIPDGCEVIDATNKIIIPAGIDIHTEFSSLNSVDDFINGSKAAITGGTGTIIDVVIPRNESESLLSAFDRVKNQINGKCLCNAALSVMILTWNSSVQKEMEVLVREKGVNSFILNISSCTDDHLFEIMECSKKLGAILRISPENKSIIRILERKMLNLGVTGPEGYSQSRPIQLEAERISNIGTFSQLSNCPVSIISLTSSEGCQALQTACINGGLLTAEIPIVALTQNGDIYYDKNLALASTYIIRNPLRPGRHHSNSLLNALSTMPMATCVSEHRASKNSDRLIASDFTKMIHGVPAVEERLSVLWEKAVCSGYMNYMRFVAVTSTNAAKAFNLYPKKGRIEAGADADITILDTTTKRQISIKNQMSLADFNAFEQLNVHCQVVATICGGKIVYQDGKIIPNINKKLNDTYLPLPPNSPHLFSQVVQRERMAGRVEKVERDESESRKSSISSMSGSSGMHGTKVNPAFQSSLGNRPISGSGVRNQFETTLNQPLSTNASRSGTKVKNPPGGRSTGFW